MVLKTLDEITAKSGDRPSEVWRRFVAMSYAALSYGQQEKVYHDAIARIKEKRPILELYAKAFAQLVDTYEKGARFKDHLGENHMELLGQRASQQTGEYFTPENLCVMMAKMTMGAVPSDEVIRFHEPASGSGRTILAAARVIEEQGGRAQQLKVTACDLTQTCAQMTYINLALWAIPAQVIHGNTLTREVFSIQRTPFWILARPGAKQSKPVLPRGSTPIRLFEEFDT